LDELHDLLGTDRWRDRWTLPLDNPSLYYPLAFYRGERWTRGDELARILGRYAAGRALEVGCGTGKNSLLMAACGASPVLLDLTREGLQLARGLLAERAAGAVYVQADACRLPFPDDAFDTVVSDCTLEHIPDYRRAFAECARVCRPAGHVIVTVPNLLRLDGWPFMGLWARLRGTDRGLARNFLPWELKRIFRDCGLEEVEAFAYGVVYAGAARVAVDKLMALAGLVGVHLDRGAVARWFLRDKRLGTPSWLGVEIGLVGRRGRRQRPGRGQSRLAPAHG